MDQEGITTILSSPSCSGGELDSGQELSLGESTYILSSLPSLTQMQEKMDEMAKSIKISNAEMDRLTKSRLHVRKASARDNSGDERY